MTLSEMRRWLDSRGIRTHARRWDRTSSTTGNQTPPHRHRRGTVSVGQNSWKSARTRPPDRIVDREQGSRARH
jgi:hypothetical protein